MSVLERVVVAAEAAVGAAVLDADAILATTKAISAFWRVFKATPPADSHARRRTNPDSATRGIGGVGGFHLLFATQDACRGLTCRCIAACAQAMVATQTAQSLDVIEVAATALDATADFLGCLHETPGVDVTPFDAQVGLWRDCQALCVSSCLIPCSWVLSGCMGGGRPAARCTPECGKCYRRCDGCPAVVSHAPPQPTPPASALE